MNQHTLPLGLEPHLSRYINFIESRPIRCSQKFKTNIHHILPKSMGGEGNIENVIILTHREHFIAHLILWKCYGEIMLMPFYIFHRKKTSKSSVSRMNCDQPK